GALAADGSYARVMWSEAFGVDDGDAGVPTCEDGEHLPFVAIVAGHLAATAQRFLTTGARTNLHLHPGGVLPVGV
ncbi:MAG: hypothetical protein AAF211_27370, partial [Myxococcota bacterium]